MDLHSLPKKVSKIDVFANQNELGLLTHGAVHHYQPTQTANHVSLTMTKPNMTGYNSGSLHPIFRQNLPEGFNRLYIAEKLARYANVDDMYLLALQKNNGIGMLSYTSNIDLPAVEAISINDILSYSGSTPILPQLLEKYYLGNALSGVQPKVSIPKTANRTGRTLEQKDLIVKSFDEEFPLLTVNEFVCMEAARHCGLNPPKTYLSENLETFIVERFDLLCPDENNNKNKGINKSNNIYNNTNSKLGYEDFTTLLKKPNTADAKYTGSYETLLKATHLYTNNLKEVKKMYELIVFNCLIGNGDAHLKNFALQYTPNMEHVFLSPPFDITHTVIYDTIDNKMALKLAGSKVFPDKKHLINLATGHDFRFRDAEKIIERLAQGILEYVANSQEVYLLKGLKQSIEASVATVMTGSFNTKTYRHDKKRKFE